MRVISTIRGREENRTYTSFHLRLLDHEKHPNVPEESRPRNLSSYMMGDDDEDAGRLTRKSRARSSRLVPPGGVPPTGPREGAGVGIAIAPRDCCETLGMFFASILPEICISTRDSSR